MHVQSTKAMRMLKGNFKEFKKSMKVGWGWAAERGTTLDSLLDAVWCL
jgi:hypothetical protein